MIDYEKTAMAVMYLGLFTVFAGVYLSIHSLKIVPLEAKIVLYGAMTILMGLITYMLSGND